MNINITEENKVMYEKFIGLRKGYICYKNNIVKISIIIALNVFFIFALGTVIYGNIVNFFNINSVLCDFLSGLSILSASFAQFPFLKKKQKKLDMQEFQKEYPDFDINIDVNELEKELEKYEVLSKIPKDIDKQQEEVIFKHDDEFKNMSNEERIQYLKNELRILEQAEQKNKYSNDDDNLQESYQKRIGSIK